MPASSSMPATAAQPTKLRRSFLPGALPTICRQRRQKAAGIIAMVMDMTRNKAADAAAIKAKNAAAAMNITARTAAADTNITASTAAADTNTVKRDAAAVTVMAMFMVTEAVAAVTAAVNADHGRRCLLFLRLDFF